MPSYYAAGVTARLSVSSLEASTTSEASIRAGPDARSKSTTAAWTIEHGKELKEKDIRCFDEDGRLHFVGRNQEVPFVCVGVIVPKRPEVNAVATPSWERADKQLKLEASPKILESVEKDDIDSSLSSLGSTPKITPDKLRADTPQAPIATPTYTPSGLSSRQASHQPSQVLKLKFVKRPSSLSARIPPPLIPTPSRLSSIESKEREADPGDEAKLNFVKRPSSSLSARIPPPLIPTPTRLSSTEPKGREADAGDEVKALTLVACFSTRSFARTQTKFSEDLKIEVYYNGALSNCAFLPARDKSNELTLRFSGCRTHRVLERAWILKPAGAPESTPGASENERERRWNEICRAMHDEANDIGIDNTGKRPPTGDLLESLSTMPLPQGDDDGSLGSAVSAHFGVIDLIVTLGTGKKFPTSEGYLSAPQRFLDDTFIAVPLQAPLTSSPNRSQVDAAHTPVASNGLLQLKELLSTTPHANTTTLVTGSSAAKLTASSRSVSSSRPVGTTLKGRHAQSALKNTDFRRLARRPCTTADHKALGLTQVAKVFEFGQQTANFPESVGLPIPHPPPLQIPNAVIAPTGIKLRFPSPKKRSTSAANVFDRASLPPMRPRGSIASASDNTAFATTSVRSVPTSLMPKAKRKGSHSISPAKASMKRKRQSETEKAQVKRQRIETPNITSDFSKTNLSSSPTRSLMPPPSSSPTKMGQYEMPELSKNSVVTFVDDKEGEGLGNGYRQIRKERGGYFKEREVLVAFRFVCW